MAAQPRASAANRMSHRTGAKNRSRNGARRSSRSWKEMRGPLSRRVMPRSTKPIDGSHGSSATQNADQPVSPATGVGRLVPVERQRGFLRRPPQQAPVGLQLFVDLLDQLSLLLIAQLSERLRL